MFFSEMQVYYITDVMGDKDTSSELVMGRVEILRSRSGFGLRFFRNYGLGPVRVGNVRSRSGFGFSRVGLRNKKPPNKNHQWAPLLILNKNVTK